jgi:hypothetical protein
MNEQLNKLFSDLMARENLVDLSVTAAIESVALLIDVSGDLGREDGTAQALRWCDALKLRGLTPEQAAELEYFRANAWQNRQQLKGRANATVWAWEQSEIQQQIFYLRKSIGSEGFNRLPALRRCQILTNLANQLSTVGRFVESLEYRRRTLELEPKFAMGLGNRGSGLEKYARSLYDPGHQALFLRFAHDDLSAALGPGVIYDSGLDGPKEYFSGLKAQIEANVDVEKITQAIRMDGYGLGRSKREQAYRLWCLTERLFLNPLNDLGPFSVGAQDVLALPSYVTSLDESPTLIGFFNQIKQEYASARWLLFDGSHADTVHFSDRNVQLINTLDYPCYGLSIEKVKVAFRMAYSLLDKLAFFIDDYMQLGIGRVYFRSMWFERGDLAKRILRPQFKDTENWPFRGLYWLAKDFVDEQFKDVMEPDAQALYDIRNRLEHSYLKVHDPIVGDSIDCMGDGWKDRLAYSVKREDFEAKALRLMKLARAAIIYLVLGMHREEGFRAKLRGPGPLGSMPLDTWLDDWKR